MSRSVCVACGKFTEDICLVLGDQWLDFCAPCAKVETVTNRETGETKTVIELVNDGSKQETSMSKKKKKMSQMDVIAGIGMDMIKGREYTSGSKESTWFATALTKLPLSKQMIKGMTSLECFIYIERDTQGGDTFETSCCVEQGINGHNASIPIPTHRAMFIGQPKEADHPTCTFRYLSKHGLESLAKVEGIEFEWKDKLPCFPKAMIIQEVNGHHDADWCHSEGIRKGLSEDHTVPIPFPEAKDADDPWLMA